MQKAKDRFSGTSENRLANLVYTRLFQIKRHFEARPYGASAHIRLFFCHKKRAKYAWPNDRHCTNHRTKLQTRLHMYCRYCGKEVKENSIVCTGCGRPVDKPGSVTDTQVMGWTWGLLLALMFLSMFVPPIGLFFGIKGLMSEATKVKASVLVTFAIFTSLLWTALILGL